ncbi:unnamed protein product [Vitrella brassicaformis CCMP3155]|uniref:Uncharacterized protein n=5 Tax=Vitrella brassicaformis TaxID=1169539 RepID=A0A0G4EJG9_VITBC|nr:unnamed protein product [Vitrella brassicaformis CCMP3155]|eukprot:CEL96895.1 unnamed protein product [Vitrella brassicaformis CCMP3155]
MTLRNSLELRSGSSDVYVDYDEDEGFMFLRGGYRGRSSFERQLGMTDDSIGSVTVANVYQSTDLGVTSNATTLFPGVRFTISMENRDPIHNFTTEDGIVIEPANVGCSPSRKTFGTWNGEQLLVKAATSPPFPPSSPEDLWFGEPESVGERPIGTSRCGNINGRTCEIGFHEGSHNGMTLSHIAIRYPGFYSLCICLNDLGACKRRSSVVSTNAARYAVDIGMLLQVAGFQTTPNMMHTCPVGYGCNFKIDTVSFYFSVSQGKNVAEKGGQIVNSVVDVSNVGITDATAGTYTYTVQHASDTLPLTSAAMDVDPAFYALCYCPGGTYTANHCARLTGDTIFPTRYPFKAGTLKTRGPAMNALHSSFCGVSTQPCNLAIDSFEYNSTNRVPPGYRGGLGLAAGDWMVIIGDGTTANYPAVECGTTATLLTYTRPNVTETIEAVNPQVAVKYINTYTWPFYFPPGNRLIQGIYKLCWCPSQDIDTQGCTSTSSPTEYKWTTGELTVVGAEANGTMVCYAGRACTLYISKDTCFDCAEGDKIIFVERRPERFDTTGTKLLYYYDECGESNITKLVQHTSAEAVAGTNVSDHHPFVFSSSAPVPPNVTPKYQEDGTQTSLYALCWKPGGASPNKERMDSLTTLTPEYATTVTDNTTRQIKIYGPFDTTWATCGANQTSCTISLPDGGGATKMTAGDQLVGILDNAALDDSTTNDVICGTGSLGDATFQAAFATSTTVTITGPLDTQGVSPGIYKLCYCPKTVYTKQSSPHTASCDSMEDFASPAGYLMVKGPDTNRTVGGDGLYDVTSGEPFTLTIIGFGMGGANHRIRISEDSDCQSSSSAVFTYPDGNAAGDLQGIPLLANTYVTSVTGHGSSTPILKTAKSYEQLVLEGFTLNHFITFTASQQADGHPMGINEATRSNRQVFHTADRIYQVISGPASDGTFRINFRHPFPAIPSGTLWTQDGHAFQMSGVEKYPEVYTSSANNTLYLCWTSDINAGTPDWFRFGRLNVLNPRGFTNAPRIVPAITETRKAGPVYISFTTSTSGKVPTVDGSGLELDVQDAYQTHQFGKAYRVKYSFKDLTRFAPVPIAQATFTSPDSSLTFTDNSAAALETTAEAAQQSDCGLYFYEMYSADGFPMPHKCWHVAKAGIFVELYMQFSKYAGLQDGTKYEVLVKGAFMQADPQNSDAEVDVTILSDFSDTRIAVVDPTYRGGRIGEEADSVNYLGDTQSATFGTLLQFKAVNRDTNGTSTESTNRFGLVHDATVNFELSRPLRNTTINVVLIAPPAGFRLVGLRATAYEPTNAFPGINDPEGFIGLEGEPVGTSGFRKWPLVAGIGSNTPVLMSMTFEIPGDQTFDENGQWSFIFAEEVSKDQAHPTVQGLTTSFKEFIVYVYAIRSVNQFVEGSDGREGTGYPQGYITSITWTPLDSTAVGAQDARWQLSLTPQIDAGGPSIDVRVEIVHPPEWTFPQDCAVPDDNGNVTLWTFTCDGTDPTKAVTHGDLPLPADVPHNMLILINHPQTIDATNGVDTGVEDVDTPGQQWSLHVSNRYKDVSRTVPRMIAEQVMPPPIQEMKARISYVPSLAARVVAHFFFTPTVTVEKGTIQVLLYEGFTLPDDPQIRTGGIGTNITLDAEKVELFPVGWSSIGEFFIDIDMVTPASSTEDVPTFAVVVKAESGMVVSANYAIKGFRVSDSSMFDSIQSLTIGSMAPEITHAVRLTLRLKKRPKTNGDVVTFHVSGPFKLARPCQAEIQPESLLNDRRTNIVCEGGGGGVAVPDSPTLDASTAAPQEVDSLEEPAEQLNTTDSLEEPAEQLNTTVDTPAVPMIGQDIDEGEGEAEAVQGESLDDIKISYHLANGTGSDESFLLRLAVYVTNEPTADNQAISGPLVVKASWSAGDPSQSFSVEQEVVQRPSIPLGSTLFEAEEVIDLSDPPPGFLAIAKSDGGRSCRTKTRRHIVAVLFWFDWWREPCTWWWVLAPCMVALASLRRL